MGCVDMGYVYSNMLELLIVWWLMISRHVYRWRKGKRVIILVTTLTDYTIMTKVIYKRQYNEKVFGQFNIGSFKKMSIQLYDWLLVA